MPGTWRVHGECVRGGQWRWDRLCRPRGVPVPRGMMGGDPRGFEQIAGPLGRARAGRTGHRKRPLPPSDLPLWEGSGFGAAGQAQESPTTSQSKNSGSVAPRVAGGLEDKGNQPPLAPPLTCAFRHIQEHVRVQAHVAFGVRSRGTHTPTPTARPFLVRTC